MRYLLVLAKKGSTTVWESDNFRSILGFLRKEVGEGAVVEKFIDTTLSESGDRKLVLTPLDRIRYDNAMASSPLPPGFQQPVNFASGVKKD